MVICAIVGYGNRSNRDKGKSFFRLPSVISHQGPQTQELSKRRQDAWLAKIKRDDLLPDQYQNTRVCSDHFVCGFPSKLYDVNNPDWTPSVKLGYESNSVGKATVSMQSRVERYERALKRQRVSMEDDNEVVTPSLEEENTPIFWPQMHVHVTAVLLLYKQT